MKIIISPAKKIDNSDNKEDIRFSHCSFLNESKELIEILKGFTPTELSKIMGISHNLGLLNADRYVNWSLPFNTENSKQAILSFSGSVYQGMNVNDFDNNDFDFAQKHLRILSGLYGILKPLDLIQPYRLEMSAKLKTEKGKNLYYFWGNLLTKYMKKEIQEHKDDYLVNLASNEYSKAININELGVPFITPVFKDLKNNKLKVISFFAKKARGKMCRFIIKNKLTAIKELQEFNDDGYIFDKDLSTDSELIYTR
ncbi:MAG: peroxide stress protein YaaA [Bacteroidota bacterium]|nr:peroxide stress protein YaaA [Bacteroidota bacterium]